MSDRPPEPWDWCDDCGERINYFALNAGRKKEFLCDVCKVKEETAYERAAEDAERKENAGTYDETN